ncbi:MAG: ferrochelatase [Acidobacteria bacterium]|nr:MAG: ferrochelatase [Acidobacteriota bacterium]
MTGSTDHSRWAVLLLAHGAPDRLGDIPEFLLNVRSGRGLSEIAVHEIIERYARIGGSSPLLRVTTQQAEELARVLGLPVYVGMRNWTPYIEDAVRRVTENGAGRVVAVCLAPQNSRTSIELYRSHLSRAVDKVAPGLHVEFVENWHDHAGLIAAFREKVSAALAGAEAKSGRPVPVVFTAHSVPQRTITDGDPYETQVRETAKLLAQAMGLAEYTVAFQSQGMTSEPWLGPTVESVIDEFAEKSIRRVLLAPIGFVSDHVEILYDIDIAFREYAQKKGICVVRPESLNTSHLFIQCLASIVSERIEIAAGRSL